MLPTWFLLTVAGVFGAVWGSFLNVVIGRVPQRESLMTRSHCPKCGHQIRNRDNIPVLGWLGLRGKCRDCALPISPRYPLVEAGTAAFFMAITYWLGEPSWLLVPLLVFACVSIALALIDVDTLTLPNAIVGPSTVALVALMTAVGFLDGELASVGRGLLAGAAMTALYGVMWFVSAGRWIGFGDVKMAFMIGVMAGYFSWSSAVVAVAAGWFLGGLVAAIALLSGRVKKGAHLPFGPFLLIGAWVGVFFGRDIANWYLNFFMLT